MARCDLERAPTQARSSFLLPVFNTPRPIRNSWKQKGGVQSWPGRPDLLDGLKAPPPLKAQLQHHVLVGLLSPNSSHMVAQVLWGELGSQEGEGTPNLKKPEG